MDRSELLRPGVEEVSPNFNKVVDLRYVSDAGERFKLAKKEILKTPPSRFVLADADGPLVQANHGWPGKTLPPKSVDFIREVIEMKDTSLAIVTSRPRNNSLLSRVVGGQTLHRQLEEQGVSVNQIISPKRALLIPFFKPYVAFNCPAEKLFLEDAHSFVFLGDGLLDRFLYDRIVGKRPKQSVNTFIRFPQAFFVPF